VVSYQSRTCFSPEMAALYRELTKLRRCTDCVNHGKKCKVLNAIIQSVYFAEGCEYFKPR